MTATATTRQPTTDPTRPRPTLYRVLSGLTSLAVILQGLWAGIFLEHDGERDASSSWIEVHARGADVAVVLALLATVAAFVRLRSRRDLWLGSGLLTALLVVESYIGGLIRDDGKHTLTAVHVPLAMAVLALAIWLPVRAGRR
jgi:lipopolysaccharide export LptBFGC system permease protein LptF